MEAPIVLDQAWWVDPERKNHKKNSFCNSTPKSHITDGNGPCQYVGNFKSKPIDYDIFFKRKELSAAITSIIGSIIVAKKQGSYYSETSTSTKNQSNEVSIKKYRQMSLK